VVQDCKEWLAIKTLVCPPALPLGMVSDTKSGAPKEVSACVPVDENYCVVLYSVLYYPHTHRRVHRIALVL
jgi:hypothetical protein